MLEADSSLYRKKYLYPCIEREWYVPFDTLRGSNEKEKR